MMTTKTTKTTRRTAKISKADRLARTTMPYVLVHLSHVDAEATLVRCTARQAMTITGANGAQITLAEGSEFYLARSDSVENSWYIIADGRCSCPAIKPCKHERALAAKIAAEVNVCTVCYDCGHRQEMICFGEPGETKLCPGCKREELERERKALLAGSGREVAVVSLQPAPDPLLAPLNGNRGFSLFR